MSSKPKPRAFPCAVFTADDLKARCRVDPGEHWHWLGHRDEHGTPGLRFGPIKSNTSLGVVACWLATGERPQKGQVWHTFCGIADCANPAHRAAGDRQSQMAKLVGVSKPLQHRMRIAAAKRQRGKLSDEDVEAMRQAKGTLAEIADRFGVSRKHVCRIRRGHVRAVGIRPDVQAVEIPSKLPSLNPRPPAVGVFSAMAIGSYMPSNTVLSRAYGAQKP
jgi:hypothetical protein